MSPFDPFRGGGRQKGTMSPFFTVYFSGDRPLVEMAKRTGESCFQFSNVSDYIFPQVTSITDADSEQKREIKARIEKVKQAHGQYTVLMRLLEP